MTFQGSDITQICIDTIRKDENSNFQYSY
jgi:hypothetical protein